MTQETIRPSVSPPAAAFSGPETVDIKEYGAARQGQAQSSDRRLFFQLLVYTGCAKPEAAAKALQKSGMESVLYLDMNDPQGIGLLVFGEDPGLFTGKLRRFLTGSIFAKFQPRPEMTMIGRTYSSGREADLEDWLLHKPRRNALNPAMKWAVWYPLRRKPEFELLTKEEQGKILFEHARIGMSYGQSGYAHDIRLACHGLDAHDNEFLLGLVGPDLYPLSRLVQDMRKTQQTARYIQSLGPFFTGQVFFRSPLPAEKK